MAVFSCGYAIMNNFNRSEMEAVVCLKCGTENDFSVRKTAKHNNAYCNGCGKYIKHLKKIFDERYKYLGKGFGYPK